MVSESSVARWNVQLTILWEGTPLMEQAKPTPHESCSFSGSYCRVGLECACLAEQRHVSTHQTLCGRKIACP